MNVGMCITDVIRWHTLNIANPADVSNNTNIFAFSPRGKWTVIRTRQRKCS